MAEIRENLVQMKEILKELYNFSIRYKSIEELKSRVDLDRDEKILLERVILSLTKQLRILNNSIPNIVDSIGIYKGLVKKEETKVIPKRVIKKKPIRKNAPKQLTRVRYKPDEKKEVSFVISDDEKSEFLRNLSISKLSIKKLKKRYSTERTVSGFGKPSSYAKLSNRFFRKFSTMIVAKGYFNKLNKNLRKINSRYVLGTYISMMLFTGVLVFFASIIFLSVLLFFNVSLVWPFFSVAQDPFYIRFVKFFWIVFVLPLVTLGLFYLFPTTEAKNLGSRIEQELPFVVIHMSAIASSGVEPVNIFKIILKSKEYRYVNIEFKKLMNLVNFHGESMANALKKISLSSPSLKLRELLNGFAVTITSGGEIRQFLIKHAENMLFDYKLEREKYNKISETFMDIYISIAIAAPMILLMIFVLIGSTGMLSNFFNLTIESLSLLLLLMISLLNIFFLIFLKLKQPVI